ncbi:hypothetical protein ABPG75_002789 [Micractinium tetrahymenae]
MTLWIGLSLALLAALGHSAGHATKLLAALPAAVCQCSRLGGAAVEAQRLLLAATVWAGLEAAAQAAIAGQELAWCRADTACSEEEGEQAEAEAEQAPSVAAAAAATAWLLAMSPGLLEAESGRDLMSSLVFWLPRMLEAARKCPGLLAVLVSGLGAAASSNSSMCLEMHRGRVLSALCEHLEGRAAASAAADAAAAPDKLAAWREAALAAAVVRLLLDTIGSAGGDAQRSMHDVLDALLPPGPGRTVLLALQAHQPAQLLGEAAGQAFAALGAEAWRELRLRVAGRIEEQAAAAAAAAARGQAPPSSGFDRIELRHLLLSNEELTAEERARASLRCANLACCQVDGPSEAALPSKRCSGCRLVRYCSAACSAADWPRHRRRCRLIVAEQRHAALPQ